MACYCGGCRDCLAAQGHYEVPVQCVVCDVALPDSNDTGFCSENCERIFAAKTRAAEERLALQLHDEEVLAKVL
jgi:predicted nucleic acid-binding Zn ribbon protein